LAVTLHIKNFQSWAEADLTAEGLTVIVGPGNTGKSALFRAFKGLVRNELNLNQVRVGGDGMEVEAVIDGVGVAAKRKRKGSTTYVVDKVDYAKLGGNVPDSLKDLKFEQVEIGDVRLDPIFASQFGGQFLIEETPTALNTILGAFSSTEKLESGKREANVRIADFNSQAKALAIEARVVEDRRARLEALSARATAIQAVIDELEPVIRRQEKTVAAIHLLIEQKARLAATKAALQRLQVPSVDEVTAGITLLTAYTNAADALQRYNRTRATLDRLVIPDTEPVAIQIKQATAFAAAYKAVSHRQRLAAIAKRLVIPDTTVVETQYLIAENSTAAAQAMRRVRLANKCAAAIEVVIQHWVGIVKTHKLRKSYTEAEEALRLVRISPAKKCLAKITACMAQVSDLIGKVERQHSKAKALAELAAVKREQGARVSALVEVERLYADAQSKVQEMEKASYEAGLTVCPNCGESIKLGDIHNGIITNGNPTGRASGTQGLSNACQVIR